MISKTYIQHYAPGRIEPEHDAVFAVLRSRGVECVLITLKQLERRRFTADVSTFFAGDHDFMRRALNFSGISYPERSTYPIALSDFLYRRIWSSSVRELLIGQRHFSPFFVKPKHGTKAFTGFIVNDPSELYKLSGLPKRTELHCSEIVEWRSEFRVFVLEGKIVGMRHYTGDKSCLPDQSVIEKAVALFEISEERTASYGIDFGVLTTGETALVEWNDGFALGAYGLPSETYADLLLARWNELTNMANVK